MAPSTLQNHYGPICNPRRIVFKITTKHEGKKSPVSKQYRISTKSKQTGLITAGWQLMFPYDSHVLCTHLTSNV